MKTKTATAKRVKLSEEEKRQRAQARKEVSRIVRTNASALVSRMQLASRLGKSFEGARDLYTALGYPKILHYEHFRNIYEREGLGTRVVDLVSDETWRLNPVLVEGNKKKINEDDDPGKLQTAFSELADKHDLWTVFNDVDAACGISRFGLLFLGLDGRLSDPAQPGCQLHYVTYRDEGSAIVEEQTICQDTSDPRFGIPTFYQIVTDERTGASARVHYSRVIHVKEGRSVSRTYGIPRLQKLINRFYDLEKVVGGGSEAFWQLINRGMTFNAKDETEMPSPDSKEFKAMQDEIDEYMHNIRRYMRLQGIEVTDLGGQPVDSDKQFLSLISYIAGATGIPQRLLLGSERGELASSQDRENFASNIETRREKFAEPRILRPFVNAMGALGILQVPPKYSVQWPSLFNLNDTEKANLANTVATAINTASNGAPETIMEGGVWADRYLGYKRDNQELIDALSNPTLGAGGAVLDALTAQIKERLAGDGDLVNKIIAAIGGAVGLNLTALQPGNDNGNGLNLDVLKPKNGLNLSPLRPLDGVSSRVLEVLSNKRLVLNVDDYSAMICFEIPEAIKLVLASKYPFIDAETYSNMHITLVYLGDYRTLSEEAIYRALDAFTIDQEPIKGNLQGIARFVGPGEKDAFVATYDSPQMPDLYNRLTACLDTEGVPYHKEHGFIPHMTMAYIGKDEDLPIQTIEPIEINFNSVYLAFGNEWDRFNDNHSVVSHSLYKMGELTKVFRKI